MSVQTSIGNSAQASPQISPEAMQAWQLPKRGLAHLRLAQAPVPEPGPCQLLLRVAAVSLNYRDKLVAEGVMIPELDLPFVPASDAAGEVVAVGAEVRRFRPGDRVVTQYVTGWVDGEVAPTEGRYGGTLGGPLPGVLAEYILVREDSAVPTPAGLSDGEAATLPIAALTAWWALFETGKLKPGQTVLVQGTGGVALFGLQFASAAGARVIVTSRSDDKLARAKALGAWQGINYASHPEWDEAVRDLTGGQGVEHVLELAGGDNLRRSAKATAPGGRISLIGFLGGQAEFAVDAVPTLVRQLTLQGIFVGHRKAFEAMNRAIEDAGIKPVIDSVYPFAKAPDAFARLDLGPFGKIVIEVG
jgi:NADPH:quinone reductase-like Zn-dependent oxidoreductase